jgi:hypothetical protein
MLPECCLGPINHLLVEKNGAPERIRTPNLLIRSQVLCPVELRARAVFLGLQGGGGHY